MTDDPLYLHHRSALRGGVMLAGDLRIECRPTVTKREKLQILQRCTELGWDTIAWTITHTGAVNSTTFSASRLETVQSVKLEFKQLKEALKRRKLVLLDDKKPGENESFQGIKQYSRLNLIVDDVLDLNCLLQTNANAPFLKHFDIISVTPGNARVFSHLCKYSVQQQQQRQSSQQQMSSIVDIISIDFTHKLDFHLNKKLIDIAVSSGIYFEVCYSQLLTTSHIRREIIHNSRLLITYLRGENILMSSGIDSSTSSSTKPSAHGSNNVNTLRGPLDLVAVGSVCFNLISQQSCNAYTKAVQSVLLHASSRQRRHFPIELLSSSDQLYDKFPQLLTSIIQAKLTASSSSSRTAATQVATVEDDEEEGPDNSEDYLNDDYCDGGGALTMIDAESSQSSEESSSDSYSEDSEIGSQDSEVESEAEIVEGEAEIVEGEAEDSSAGNLMFNVGGNDDGSKESKVMLAKVPADDEDGFLSFSSTPAVTPKPKKALQLEPNSSVASSVTKAKLIPNSSNGDSSLKRKVEHALTPASSSMKQNTPSSSSVPLQKRPKTDAAHSTPTGSLGSISKQLTKINSETKIKGSTIPSKSPSNLGKLNKDSSSSGKSKSSPGSLLTKTPEQKLSYSQQIKNKLMANKLRL